MSTQLVQHKSRNFEVVMNFAATENNLSGAFIAENDGEIYDVVLNNIASYTIGGGAPTIPYILQAGLSYYVSITKITNGQPASVTLKTRRAVNKSVVINAIDFTNLQNGNDLYVFSRNSNRLIIIDKTKINTANYAGGGSWNNSIIKNDILLPSLPSPGTYDKATFLINNKILLFGTKNYGVTPTSIYATLYDVANNVFTDLSGNSAVPYTLLITLSFPLTTDRFLYYNLSSSVYFRYVAGGYVYDGKLDLNTNVISTAGSTPMSIISNYMNKGACYYNPINDRFISASDVSIDLDRTYNFKNVTNRAFAFNINSGRSVSSSSFAGSYVLYNEFGQLVSIIGTPQNSLFVPVSFYSFLSREYFQMSNYSGHRYVNILKDDLSAQYNNTFSDHETAVNTFLMCAIAGTEKVWSIVGDNSSPKRIHFASSNYGGYIGYFDCDYVIRDIFSNTILL